MSFSEMEIKKRIILGLVIFTISAITIHFVNWFYFSTIELTPIYQSLHIGLDNSTNFRNIMLIVNSAPSSLDNVDIFIPVKIDDLNIDYENSAQNCVRVSTFTNDLNVHCEKIFRGGKVQLSWEPNEGLPNSSYLIANYNTETGILGLYRLPIPYLFFPKVVNLSPFNESEFFERIGLTHQPECDVYIPNYPFSKSNKTCIPSNLSIGFFEPLRKTFYNGSIGLVRFGIIGKESGSYDFRIRWYDTSNNMFSEHPASYALVNHSSSYNQWVYLLKDVNNGTWTLSLDVVSLQNSTSKNTTFDLISNENLVGYLRNSSCSNLNYDTVNSAVNLISYESSNELQQTSDILEFFRKDVSTDSYNSSLEFLRSLRSVGIPTRIVIGYSSIGSNRYWNEFYYNDSWIPVDVSSQLPIGKFSENYKNNITEIIC